MGFALSRFVCEVRNVGELRISTIRLDMRMRWTQGVDRAATRVSRLAAFEANHPQE
jgi:hypothetical protein